MTSVKTSFQRNVPANKTAQSGTTFISNVTPTTSSSQSFCQEGNVAYSEPRPSATTQQYCDSKAANNTNPQNSNQQLYFSHTNIVVKSIDSAVTFYERAFNWEIIKKSDSAAVMQYKNYTFYIVAEDSVSDYFGYTAVSPQTSGHSPSMTTTLLCNDVSTVWNQALIAGAIPVKSPYTKSNGSTCATLVGPENYIWFITDSNNFFC